MSSTYRFEVRELPAQNVAFATTDTVKAELGPAIGRLLGKVGALFKSGEAVMAGPPFCRYTAWGADGAVTIDAGAPTEAPVAPRDGIQGGTLGGGPVLCTRHVGPYDRLEDAYCAAREWLEGSDWEPAGFPWDSYITDPGAEPDPGKWITDIYWPVRSKAA